MRKITWRQQIAFATAVCLVCGTCACAGAGEETASGVILPEDTVPEETTVENTAYVAAAASSMEVDKEETVQVKADANGGVTEITVETRLKHSAESTIADLTNLENIKNTEGDEEYTLDGDGNLTWENHGEDLHYEGTTDAELPVEVTVTYLLDGDEISPAELAGQSGRLTIRFDYENHTSVETKVDGETITTCVPFLAMSVLTMDEDIFSNIETENGKVVSMNGTSMFIGYAYPGLADTLALSDYDATDEIEIPSYTELTADVQNFELDFTATIVTRGTFEDLDEEDLTDIDDLIDSCEELRDASEELVDGTEALEDGAEAFGDGLEEYTDGVSTLAENNDALLEGAQALRDGLGTLNSSLSSVNLSGSGSFDTDALTAAMTALGSDYAALAAYVSCSQAAYAAALQTQVAAGTITSEQAEAVTATYTQLLDAYMNAALEQYGISTVSGGDVAAQTAAADMGTQLTTLQTALTNLASSLSGLSGLSSSLNALKSGVSALSSGSAQLVEGLTAYLDGVDALNEAEGELSDGYGKLSDGIGELADGFVEFDEEGIQELTDLATPDLKDVTARLRALKAADASYTNFGGILPDATGSVTFIIETEGIE